MACAYEICPFSEWLLNCQDLNFLEGDVVLVKDQLLSETSGNRCFQFLEGSTRKSPRLRCREGNCIIIQYLGNHLYLARGSSVSSPSSTTDHQGKVPQKKKKHLHEPLKSIRFLIFDETASSSQNTKIVFEWQLYEGQPRPQKFSLGLESSRAPTSGVDVFLSLSFPHVHFESFVSSRKRFVVIVGPPCLGDGAKDSGTNSTQPTNCVFDSEEEKMKVFHLKRRTSPDFRTGSVPSDLWAANVVFDPRPNREPVAALVACRTKFSYLPRSSQPGYLVLYDFRRQRVVHELHDRLFCSDDLKYTCTGSQLLTSVVDDDVTNGSRRRLIMMLSADDLTFLRLLPVSSMTSVLSSVLSTDRRKVALFMRKDDDVTGSNRSTGNDALSTSIDSSVEVALIRFPADVRSLQRLCLDAVRRAIREPETLSSLPVPRAIVTHLSRMTYF